MSGVYYNENNPEACAMLAQLMRSGCINEGIIDDRPIQEVQPNELKNFHRCHFFAGIGGWDMALHLADWPNERPVWTGSCPCQPFSSAGRQKGKRDERHLWPVWFRLIKECRPPVLFGEQVASAVAHGWLDDAYEGLEGEDYAVGAAVLPACSVGAPHRRDRLWFVANHQSKRRGQEPTNTTRGVEGSCEGQEPGFTHDSSGNVGNPQHNECNSTPLSGSHATTYDHWTPQGANVTEQFERASNSDIMADSPQSKCQRPLAGEKRESGKGFTNGGGDVGNADEQRLEGWQTQQQRTDQQPTWTRGMGAWLGCPDGKQRLVEPSIPLLVDGFPHRRPILHALGNAIVPQVAAEFIKASKGVI